MWSLEHKADPRASVYLARAGAHKCLKCCETGRERDSQSNGGDDDHTLFILALEIVCEALIILHATVSIRLVAFFLVSAGDENSRAVRDE